jgi:peroxiredoxin
MKAAAALACALLTCTLLAPAQAQTAAPPRIEGRTLEGKPFQLAGLKGKVVLVMLWSTDCAVCRDKMPELRRNYEGWAGKPFELVLVSVDKRMADVTAYEQIISRTVPLKQRFVQLWAGEPGYQDSFAKPAQLPASFLVDKTGRIVQQWQGRIPAEAWDQIADLL